VRVRVSPPVLKQKADFNESAFSLHKIESWNLKKSN
jgi:hypothetical protein